MSTLTSEDILRALRRVIDPELGHDLVSLGMIHNPSIEDDVAQFTLRLTTPACPVRDQLARMAHDSVAAQISIRQLGNSIQA